jgi:tripartite ATP-independent transporter DctP family solute receptor
VKRIIFIILTIVIAGGFAFAEGQQEAAKTIVLRLAETHPADYPTTRGDQEFARLVEERTNGRIKVEVYHSKQLGEEKAAIEQVQFGAIDFTRVSIAPVADFYPPLNALQMPYVYNSGDHMWKVLDSSIGEEVLKNIEASNFVGLCYYDGGARNFYNSVKEIKSVADLKGLKIRVMQSKLMVDMINALGAVPQPLPYGEVYSAIQTGVIDGAENNWPSYLTSSHYEVAKYYTVDEHLRVPEILIASKIVFDKLSAEDQAIIKKAAKDSVAFQKKAWADYAKEAEMKVREAGCIITELADKSAFQSAMQPLYDALTPAEKAVVERVRKIK